MTRPSRRVLSAVPLACLLVAAVLITVLTPLTTAQRITALSVVGVGLAWLAVLLIALARTPEGPGRLGGSPPLALDLLPVVAFIGCSILVDAMGPPRSGVGSGLAGAAAGGVLMVPFSFTVRWLWFERERRRRRAPDTRPRPADASLEDRDRTS